jgi:hypothetical protein
VLPLIRWLANHHNPRVVLGVGVILACSAVGVAAVGFSRHQPAVARIGVLLMLMSILYAVLVIRSRRARTDH